jgi:hypothetical protein
MHGKYFSPAVVFHTLIRLEIPTFQTGRKVLARASALSGSEVLGKLPGRAPLRDAEDYFTTIDRIASPSSAALSPIVSAWW